MLENIPTFVGKVLGGVRAGTDKTVSHKDFGDVPETIVVTSPAFGRGSAMPADASADGRMVSPALTWDNVPSGTAELVLIVEDADSPSIEPLVHAIVLDLPGRDGGLAEGALPSEGGVGQGAQMGKNSFMKGEYLPADPPSGHGPHRYLFQIFALGHPLKFSQAPGRTEVVEAMRPTVFAKGVLIGTYERV